MSMYHSSMPDLIGNTPIVELKNYEEEFGLKVRLLAKLEGYNPGGSAKDRVALAMIEGAEKKGLLQKGATVIEPTSGNTGIGLACVCAAKGYKLILTMPDTMSVERRKLLAAYGAEVVLTDGSRGMSAAIEKAEELVKEIPGSFMPGQFTNPDNPAVHFDRTGYEIYQALGKEVDIFVAGIGTGGTISGIGRLLKEKIEGVKVVGFEPAGSPFLTEGKTGTHNLQGIGAGFKPEVLDLDVIDEILTISDEEAYEAGRFLARHEGLLVGITSGAAVAAAAKLAKRPENEGKMIVALLPDSGERYLSTEMFAD